MMVQNATGTSHTYYLGYNGGYLGGYALGPYQAASLWPTAGLPAQSDQSPWVLTSDGGAHADILNTTVSTSGSQDLFYTYPATMR
jgi:hypothetical protein